MNEKTIWIIPFTGEKEKQCMWSGKFMAIAVIKGYHVLLECAKKIPAYDKYETKEKI